MNPTIADPPIGTFHTLFIPRQTSEEKDLMMGKMRTCAKKTLGYGYYRHEDKPPEMTCLVSKKVVDEDISIVNLSDFSCHIEEYPIDSSVQAQDVRFESQLGVMVPKFINASVTYDTSGKSITTKQTDRITYVVRRIVHGECNLIDPFEQKEDLKYSQNLGNAYARSCQVYAGYQFSFEISRKSSADKSTKHASIFADLFFGKAGLTRTESSSSGMTNDVINRTFIGFGGYTQPEIELPPSTGRIAAFVKAVNSDFYQSMPSLEWKAEAVFLDRFIFKGPISPSVRTSPAAFSHPALPTFAPINFSDLAERIAENLGNDGYLSLKGDLERFECNLSSILISMNKAFKSTLYHMEHPQTITGGYTEVMGKSGAGKSLLIGYLLGAKITSKYTFNGHSNDLDFDYSEQENPKQIHRYPKVGHGRSETPGASVYEDLIDTAGDIDTEGGGADICNAVAISIITSRYRPTRLIVAMDVALFSVRFQDFIDLTQKLRRCLRNLTDPETMSSILFLVNDREGLKNEESIRGYISKAIVDAKGALKDFLKQYNLSALYEDLLQTNTLKQSRQASEDSDNIPYKGNGVFDEINPVEVENIIKKLQEISFLELVLKKIRIEMANFLKPDTRNRINVWKNDPETGHLKPDSFSMELLKVGGFDVFKIVLTATTDYFNSIFKEKGDLYSQKDNYEERDTIAATISRLLDAINAPTEANVEQQTQDFNQAKTDRDELRTQLTTLKSKKKNQEDTRAALLENENSMDYTTLWPPEQMKPRSFFALKNSWARTYKISHDNPITPILEARLNPMELTSFVNVNENKDRLHNGHYDASLQPKWWGYTKDSEASVKLTVRTKDHFNTKAKVAEINLDLEKPYIGTNARIEKLIDRIKGYDADIENLGNNISRISSAEERKKVNEALLETREADLTSWDLERLELIYRLAEIEHNLVSFKDFYTLLSRIVDSLGEGAIKSEEREKFQKFCENVASCWPEDRTVPSTTKQHG
jgi:hypothetical protein